jgi:hypothetical protein
MEDDTSAVGAALRSDAELCRSAILPRFAILGRGASVSNRISQSAFGCRSTVVPAHSEDRGKERSRRRTLYWGPP